MHDEGDSDYRLLPRNRWSELNENVLSSLEKDYPLLILYNSLKNPQNCKIITAIKRKVKSNRICASFRIGLMSTYE